MIGCLGCLGVVGLAIVDALPWVAMQPALRPGSHVLWAQVLIVVLGLGTGPVVSGLLGYGVFRSRDRLLATFERRWPGATERDNAAALNLSEATFAAAVAVALAAGAAVGLGAVAVLDAVLP